MNQTEKIVREFFAAFSSGDVSAIDTYFDENIEYVVVHEDQNETNRAVPWIGKYKGITEVKGFLNRLLSNIVVEGISADDIIANENKAAVFGKFEYLAQSTGVKFFSYFAIKLEVTDGKISKYHFYEDTFSVAFAFRSNGQWASEYSDSKTFIPEKN